MKSVIRSLPDSELTVMLALWACSVPAARSDIQQKLSRPMAQTTLLTLLSRLAEKDFVRIEKNGRSNLYTPAVSQKDYLAAQGSRFFRTLCGGKISAFAAALCDSGLSKEELDTLRALLEEDRL